MAATSTIRFDLEALSANLQAVASLPAADGAPLGLDRLCAVVKADAYGLGAARVAAAMHRIGIRRFAAYDVDEAVTVAEASPGSTVVVLMPVRRLQPGGGLQGLLSRGRLQFTAHQSSQVRDLACEADRLGVVLPLHLELDTGMGRGGCDEDEALEILQCIAASPRLELAGVMTHLPDAVADPMSALDRGTRFEAFLRRAGDLIPRDVVRHVAATAALGSGSLRFDQVRIGLAWLGHGAATLADRPDPVVLRPVVSWWSRIIQVRSLSAGRTVGYGCSFTTTRETRVGLVPVGYADGFPPAREGRTHQVVVHGRTGPVAVPVLGRMNMDQCVVDLTDVGPLDPEAAVELISTDPASPVVLGAVAHRAGALPYQVLCGLGPRVPRLLVAGEAATVEVMPVRNPSSSGSRLGSGIDLPPVMRGLG